MINFLAYPNLLLFWFLEPRIKCKRIFSSCVSLFSYQGSCLATAILDYHIFSGLSRTFFIFLKIYFFKFFLFSSTARLGYHRISNLSTSFFAFFYFFVQAARRFRTFLYNIIHGFFNVGHSYKADLVFSL